MLALRPAMNTPVLNVGFLPVGPARAAIVAFAEEWGGIGMALGIRSNEGGQLGVIRNQEPLDFDTPIAEALEPMLEEAERMGFLFDEDIVATMPGDKGRAHALGLWDALMGELETPAASKDVSAGPAGQEPEPTVPGRAAKAALAGDAGEDLVEELELDDLAELDDLDDLDLPEIDLSLDDAMPPSRPKAASVAPDPPPRAKALPKARKASAGKAESARAARSAAKPEPVSKLPPVAPAAASVEEPDQPTLSKFRHADQAAARAAALPADAIAPEDGDADAGNNALGRIPLVRVRREREGSKRVPYLARLLSSF